MIWAINTRLLTDTAQHPSKALKGIRRMRRNQMLVKGSALEKRPPIQLPKVAKIVAKQLRVDSPNFLIYRTNTGDIMAGVP
jgi:hypothetical protein